MKRTLFFILGLLFLALAYFGILLPGIPAIPFILLSGWFFFYSSEKLYNWMLRARFIGPVLKKFYASEKVSQRMRWFVISQLWVSIIVALFIFPLTWMGITFICLGGIIGSFFIYKLIS